jgi:hypothetical protein
VAVRTTDTAVKAILLGNYDLEDTPDLTAFMDSAAILIKRVEACDSNGVLDEEDLEIIERWLSAHFYSHADQLLQSKSTGDASASFQGRTGMGLESTQYGQTAMNLDGSGCLEKINDQMKKGGKPKPSINWMGKAVSQQTAYGDRD